MIPAEALARPALPEHEARKELLVLAATTSIPRRVCGAGSSLAPC